MQATTSRSIAQLPTRNKVPTLVLLCCTLALPKMRKYSYPILLGRKAAETALLPRQAGQVTLLRISDGRVTDVTFIDSAQALTRALKQD